jgi:hypothetical protein
VIKSGDAVKNKYDLKLNQQRVLKGFESMLVKNSRKNYKAPSVQTYGLHLKA